jgi:hypothetical protein
LFPKKEEAGHADDDRGRLETSMSPVSFKHGAKYPEFRRTTPSLVGSDASKWPDTSRGRSERRVRPARALTLVVVILVEEDDVGATIAVTEQQQRRSSAVHAVRNVPQKWFPPSSRKKPTSCRARS